MNTLRFKEYIARKLEKDPEINKLHLVLQSAPEAEKYFSKYLEGIDAILE